MNSPTTARAAGMMGCHDCGLVSGPYADEAKPHCPQCQAELEYRKPQSLDRTWAFLIAAVVFYIPANVLPVMRTTTLGRSSDQTIMEGVIYFIHAGEWPIALVIFTASIMVPTIKISILVFLLMCAHRGSRWRPEDRSRLYNFTEFVGRWSMIDIFVISIMVALVRLGELATIEAGMGAIFFAGVVILTMLAAQFFDPRIIWDNIAFDTIDDDQLNDKTISDTP